MRILKNKKLININLEFNTYKFDNYSKMDSTSINIFN